MIDFDYNLVRDKRIGSSLRLSIHPEKGVIVKAPFWVPNFQIQSFLKSKEDWIKKHLENITSKRTPSKNYSEGETHFFFGKEYRLRINTHPHPTRTTISILDDFFDIKIYHGHQEQKRSAEIHDAILRFYLEEGIGVITAKVNHFSGQLGVAYSKIDLKKVSSIWGSCSPDNKLSFNRKLIMAPHEVVDYVVIHEVCHLVHRNHSSRFWALVSKFDPDYKAHRRWLFRNSLLLNL